MSIPLDRLYHHLKNLCSEDTIIYRWDPHGSKNLDNLMPIEHFTQKYYMSMPILVAHDQEPLDYEHFEAQDHRRKDEHSDWNNFELYKDFIRTIPKLKIKVGLWNIYDKVLLCHSEKNSSELLKFEPHFIGVYYWSHAIIARDWFRFAEHDRALVNDPTVYNHDFLIYNRAWSGTREYRLKFAELLIDAQLVSSANVKFSEFDSGLHYTDHKFKNVDFEINSNSIQHKINANTFTSTASADYDSDDYNSCGIEVVLETLFDDTRNHLTEKTLRPVACGKPFILVSTPGSLQYLKDYGFKTFGEFIDESYDLIQDPVKRLECIIQEMQRINNMHLDLKLELFRNLNEIAAYNKILFFSKAWQQQIADEFEANIECALGTLRKHKSARAWTELKSILVENEEMGGKFTSVFGAELIELFETVSTQNS